MKKISQIIQKVLSKKGNAFFYTPPYYGEVNSFLFQNTTETISLNNLNNLKNILDNVDSKKNNGFPFYAVLKYELGYCFEEKLNEYLDRDNENYGDFYFFNKENVINIKSEEIEIDNFNTSPENFSSEFKLQTSKSEFVKDIGTIKKYIEEGYTYQVNYTICADFQLTCSIEEFISILIFNQTARYIAVINLGDEIILSISPELFFSVKDDKIISRPMKGTIKRGLNIPQDESLLNQLKASLKDKAENIMIVDLIRNDLGRICEFNSVLNTHQFVTEKYETVYQLTSKVKGKLTTSSLNEILKNIFPCGSITGAPKIKTMEIIRELEKRERGVYTGAIGFFDGEQTIFNVPIRTIQINSKSRKSKIGIGSGIVWDSDALSEYEECKSKAAFVTNPQPHFQLIETMLVEERQIFLVDYHIIRLKKAAEFFLFMFDEDNIRNKLSETISGMVKGEKYKIRLLLDKWGKVTISTSNLVQFYSTKVILSNESIKTTNKFQYFKTTNRLQYDKAFSDVRSNGFFDCLFLNERNELAEGAITNIFIKRKDKLITPPIDSGVLNGCYRQYLLDNNKVEEDIISVKELMMSNKIYVGNSVSKLLSVSVDLNNYIL